MYEDKENVDFDLQPTNQTTDWVTNSPSSIGRKRPLEQVESNILDDEHISVKKLKKYVNELEDRVKNLEKMFRHHNSDNSVQIVPGLIGNSNGNPLVPMNDANDSTINDIVDNGSFEDNNSCCLTNNTVNNITFIKNEETNNPLSSQRICFSELDGLKQSNATTTARNFMRHFYPDPDINMKLSDIDKSLIDTIIDRVQKLHPKDTTTRMKIRSAMSNYFGLNAFRKKKMARELSKKEKNKIEGP